jgi:membrane-associated phospholipid phosphatase
MDKIRLPGIRSRGAKYAWGLACAMYAAVLYMGPNRFHWAQPAELPMTAIDNAVPFIPATGWIYVAIYLFLVGSFIALRDLERASRFLYACAFVQLVAAAIFILWPTVYPRELFPVSAATHPVNVALVDFFRRLDAPANCFPSLHITTGLLCAAALRPQLSARAFAAVAAAALLFAASTLTFKQHYFADIASAVLLGALGYFMFFRWKRIEVQAR